MSDPMNSPEIEDVLASIRRLVSLDPVPVRPAPQAQPDPAPGPAPLPQAPAPVEEPPGAALRSDDADQGDENAVVEDDGCLVLTPALRVEGEDEFSAEAAPAPATPDDLGAELQRLEHTIAELEAAVGDVPTQEEPTLAGGGDVDLAPGLADAEPQLGDEYGADPDPLLTTAPPRAWPADDGGDVTGAGDLVEEIADDPGAPMWIDAEEGPDGQFDTLADAGAPVEGGAEDAAEAPDGSDVADASWAPDIDGTHVVEDLVPSDQAEAQETTEETDAAVPEDDTPRRLHLHEAAPDHRSGPRILRPQPEARRHADVDDDEEESIFAGSDTLIDEETLRILVADIIRKELQGSLGERITRNVRKLVRREIQRALSSQDFD
ncbi:hypothetical protein [Phaeovulum sp. NW3]|uniref:hypothetical protein n=1 Tax=Phaeovulum sp. NW3 TaxID=2934933 RepID=UPI0020222176|nr:hypothetical protein [Phaeovulum sp. NW3]MCL7464506.1 hypothetical protein [Phaeovulum sp. NW3]